MWPQAQHCRLAEGRTEKLEALAQATGTHPRSLYRVLRYLASIGVFTEGAAREFGLTPSYGLSATGFPGRTGRWPLCRGGTLPGVGRCSTASRQVSQLSTTSLAGVFAYLAEHPEGGSGAQRGHDRAGDRKLKRSCRPTTSPYARLSIGGGWHISHGSPASKPAGEGILFNQPHVVAGATKHVRPVGRWATAWWRGLLHGAVAGGDALCLARVLQTGTRYTPSLSSRLLPRHGRPWYALVIRQVIPPGNAPSAVNSPTSICSSLPAAERQAEYRAVCGGRLHAVADHPTQSLFSVIEGAHVTQGVRHVCMGQEHVGESMSARVAVSRRETRGRPGRMLVRQGCADPPNVSFDRPWETRDLTLEAWNHVFSEHALPTAVS